MPCGAAARTYPWPLLSGQAGFEQHCRVHGGVWRTGGHSNPSEGGRKLPTPLKQKHEIPSTCQQPC